MPANKPAVGIMALYLSRKRLEERAYFAKLVRAAERMGMQAFVFTPEDVRGNQILAHLYNTKDRSWSRKLVPFPDVIYDRCRYQPNERFRKLQQFRKQYPHLLYMNRPLANKWVIYQLLSKNRSLKPHLPETVMLNSTNTAMSLLSRYHRIYTKPINGTGGRGILCIERLGAGRFRVRGRDLRRRILKPRICTAKELKSILLKQVARKNCIAQQGIDIRLPNGRVHDFRVLIQKNGSGKWQFTGGAARVGARGSITSNLHGGGKAVAMDKLLEKRFSSSSKARDLQKQVEELSFQVVRELEQKFHDLCEIALDLAIDHQGRIWMLELNPKPSREVFARIGKSSTYQTAIMRPLEYARWLYQQRGSK